MIEAVASPLEGAPRQFRRWSDDFKAQAVAEAMEPGASVSAIARRIGIDPSQLFTWRRTARLKAAAVNTMAKGDLLSVNPTGNCSTVDITIGDAMIRVDATITEAHLIRLIRAVRTA
ncbi:transposase [Rhizobium sp. 2YAF20]|uniref:transposase n=1 Tax=Rhizobium sp. 2YAF20 TaxID=3233027 RepID=UPI003F9A79A3